MRCLHLILILFFFNSCKIVTIYPNETGPVWLSNEVSTEAPVDLTDLSVVSFNIEKSEKIDLAIEELKSIKDFNKPDILLLQEMDEAGVKKIAEAFEMNYLYFPASVQKNGEHNFGNAILSKTKLTEAHKLILPHARVDKQIRCATSCFVNIGDKRILIYSVHLETIMVTRKKRHNQMDALVTDILTKIATADAVIVGGDFNTLYKKDLEALVDKFDKVDLDWQTKELGATGSFYFNLIKPSNDHIFTSGLKLLSIGKMQDCRSSDHWPIHVQVSM